MGPDFIDGELFGSIQSDRCPQIRETAVHVTTTVGTPDDIGQLGIVLVTIIRGIKQLLQGINLCLTVGLSGAGKQEDKCQYDHQHRYVQTGN